jgi:hypothetical protein
MSAVKARTGDAALAAAAARAGSAALEEGAMPMPSVKRTPRRRQGAYRLPASVALVRRAARGAAATRPPNRLAAACSRLSSLLSTRPGRHRRLPLLCRPRPPRRRQV